MNRVSAQRVRSGADRRDRMFELFRSGEILPDGRTNQDEEALIEGQNKAKVRALLWLLVHISGDSVF